MELLIFSVMRLCIYFKLIVSDTSALILPSYRLEETQNYVSSCFIEVTGVMTVFFPL